MTEAGKGKKFGRSRQCDECYPLLKDPSCTLCGGRGSLPLAPSIGDLVVWHRRPLLVMATVLRPSGLVSVEGWAFRARPGSWEDGPPSADYVTEILGPGHGQPGMWDWKEARR